MSDYDSKPRKQWTLRDHAEWEEDHGYQSGYCRYHGNFKTDGELWCPRCPSPEEEEEEED